MLVAGQPPALIASANPKSVQTKNIMSMVRPQIRTETFTSRSSNKPQYRYINLSENPLIYEQLNDFGYADTLAAEKEDSLIPGIVIYADHFGSDEVNRLAKDGVVIGPDSYKNYMSLKSGNFLFTPDKPMVIGSRQGNISIGAGATVFIMQTTDSLVLYYLRQGETKVKQVSVAVNKHKLTMEPGYMLVLTKQNTNNFDKLEADCHQICHHNAKRFDWQDEPVKAFIANFSIVSALATIEPLNRLLVSNNKQDRLALQRLVKDSAILGDLPTIHSQQPQPVANTTHRTNVKVAADMDQ